MSRTVYHLARVYGSGIGSRVACGKVIDTVRGRTNLLYVVNPEGVTCTRCKQTVYYTSVLNSRPKSAGNNQSQGEPDGSHT